MTHKFKLKKDGQENYIKFDEGKLWYSGNNKDWFECNENFDVSFWLRYDSIHLFVCTDKNGEDVFADDPVWFHWRGKKTKAEIVKKDFFLRLIPCGDGVWGLPRTLCKFDIQHIELIEASKDV